jgi:hypothetical protein
VEGIAYYLMSFRISLGDFEVDTFSEQENRILLYVTWFIWVIAVFVTCLVFMNFIIAVISASYENVMAKAVARSFKEKVEMIKEREGQMSPAELKNPLYFPMYLVLRQPVGEAEDQEEFFIQF